MGTRHEAESCETQRRQTDTTTHVRVRGSERLDLDLDGPLNHGLLALVVLEEAITHSQMLDLHKSKPARTDRDSGPSPARSQIPEHGTRTVLPTVGCSGPRAASWIARALIT